VAVAALVASVLLALVGSKTAEAAFPGKNGKIAYSTLDSSFHSQIYTVPAGGGKPTKVTTDAIDHEDPTFSPDGNTIAYNASDGSHFQIYTVPFPSSGETPTPVTSGAANHYLPAFSPDPTNMKIAYSGFDGSKYQIYTIPAGGGTPTPLTNEDEQHYNPDFSPDGDTIVYHSFDSSNNSQLYTIPSVPLLAEGRRRPLN
jgi:Tol biopolymer transport system component